MFFGEYQHSLDAKGRVILPAKFRERLEGGAYVTKLLDGCLAVYPPDVFTEVAAEMNEKAKRGPRQRNAARSFFAGTVDVAPDRQGRIPIPQHLRDFAGLERDVVVNGAFNRIEIWDAERWRALNREAEQELAGGGSALSDLGM
jgi:MraZ protein